MSKLLMTLLFGVLLAMGSAEAMLIAALY